MQFVTISSAISLASVVLAAPLQTCLTPEEASCIIEKYNGVLDGTGYDNKNANVTAQALIADDFTWDSDSFASLQERPLDDGYATNKDLFMSELYEYGPWPNIHTNEVIVGCNKIAWYWTIPQADVGGYRVKGFILLEVNSQFQICKVYSEFNSIAWGLDRHLDIFCPTNPTY
ncbi:hypothetical protein KC361_g1129 [Hortaea werneckii]|nr:hypothetical protein KC361_g1129 [Hortaea werneckii]